jgi:putative hydrolase of HD superfamily
MAKDLYGEVFELKKIERTGWKKRQVQGRRESDAEHIFSMTILALEIIAKNNLKLNVEKVLKLIAYHEFGEVDTGDLTPFCGVSREEKFKLEKAGVKRIAKDHNMPEIEKLWLEFEECKTPEAIFVKKIDKYDTVRQARLYAQEQNRPELYEEFYNNQKAICDEMDKLLTPKTESVTP